MQSDHIEQFIQENREAFDTEIPSLKAWAAIDQSLGLQEKRSAKRIAIWKTMRVAAAVIALLVCGGLVGSYMTRIQLGDTPANLAQISPEYAELEQFYQTQIQDKYNQLVSYDQEDVVNPDLNQLDEIMEELRSELANAPEGSEEQIIENLIQSYQTKVDILERVLERIQISNPKTIKTEDDEISI